jgi:hypothetical protein
MLILSRVCADFYDKRNNLLFRITPSDLGLFVDAPEAIREDPLFQMLVDDKSIKFPEDAKTNKALENDPYAGATAEGKEIKETKPRTVKPKTETKVKPKEEANPDPDPADTPVPIETK